MHVTYTCDAKKKVCSAHERRSIFPKWWPRLRLFPLILSPFSLYFLRPLTRKEQNSHYKVHHNQYLFDAHWRRLLRDLLFWPLDCMEIQVVMEYVLKPSEILFSFTYHISKMPSHTVLGLWVWILLFTLWLSLCTLTSFHSPKNMHRLCAKLSLCVNVSVVCPAISYRD